MRYLVWMVVLGLWTVLTACHTAPLARPDSPVVPISFPITNSGGSAIVLGPGLILTADHVLPKERQGIPLMRVGDELTGYEIVASGPGDGTTASWAESWEKADWDSWSKDWVLLRLSRPELATESVSSIDWSGTVNPGDTVYLIGYTFGRSGPELTSVKGQVKLYEGLDSSGDFFYVATSSEQPYPGCSGGIVARLCKGSAHTPPSFEMVGMYRGAFRQVVSNGSVNLLTQVVRRPPPELKARLDN